MLGQPPVWTDHNSRRTDGGGPVTKGRGSGRQHLANNLLRRFALGPGLLRPLPYHLASRRLSPSLRQHRKYGFPRIAAGGSYM